MATLVVIAYPDQDTAEEAGDSLAVGGGVDHRVRQSRARRLKHYRRLLALLEERLPASPLVREECGELAALLPERTIRAGAR